MIKCSKKACNYYEMNNIYNSMNPPKKPLTETEKYMFIKSSLSI